MNIGLDWVFSFFNLVINVENIEDHLDISPALSNKSPESSKETKRDVHLQDVEVEDDKVWDSLVSLSDILVG